MGSDNELECLVGEPVSAVSFVMDYVEFHFNGPILRALSNPIIESSGSRLTFGEPGSRDALCSLIGTEVEAIDVREGDAIEILMASGQKLVVPLDEGRRTGPEAAHFVPGIDEGILVW